MFNKYSIGMLVFLIVLGLTSVVEGQILVDKLANIKQDNSVLSTSEKLLQKKISLSLKKQSLKNVLKEIQRKSGVHVFYTRNMLQGNPKVSLRSEEESLGKLLDRLLKPQELDYWATGTYIILQKKKRSPIVESVSGQVTDAGSGEPLPGVNVVVEGTSSGTATTVNGKFELSVKSLQDTLIFSFIGYQSQIIPINGRTTINVALQPETVAGEELVVVGYGTQEKAAVTGSISSVKSEDLESINTTDLSTGLAGRLPGLRVKQNSSEPGSFDTNFDIRGFGDPLIVVDGMEMKKRDFSRLDPNIIEDITILKDASASVYGVKAANGVVLVTTKQGEKGKPTITYSGNYEMRSFTKTPEPMTAYQFAVYTTESELNQGKSPNQTTFKPEGIENYNNGSNVGTDWDGLVQRDYSTANTHNLNISGGGENIQYFTSLGYVDEMGMWKSGDLNYNKYNLRANITSQITDDLEIELNVDGMKDLKNEPGSSAFVPGSIGGIFFSLFMQDPTVPVYANNSEPYYSVTYDGQHPLAITTADIGGYTKTKSQTFEGVYTMNYEVPFLNGVNAEFKYGYYNLELSERIWNPIYHMYSYNDATEKYEISATKNNPANLVKENNSLDRSTLQGQLSYQNVFLGNHNIDAQLIYESRNEKSDNLWTKSEFDANVDYFFAGTKNQQVDSDNIYESVNRSVIGKLSYDYASKYLFEFGFNLGGSSLFPEKKRWGFFPYTSLGWRLTEEKFFSDELSFITNLKLRGSWGIMGDDRAANFQFLTGYTYPSGNYLFNDQVVPGLGFRGLANPNITWTEVTSKNIGIDLEIENGLLNVEFDVFQRDRSGLLATRTLTLPGTVGINLPQENLNKDMQRGFELVLGHSQNLGEFQYQISTNLSYTRSQATHIERTPDGNSYLNWKNNTINRWENITWGYRVEGQFQSKEEILNSPLQGNQGNRYLLPGDIKYEDVNNDGVINNLDEVPIGKGTFPEVNYGMSGSFSYKHFDMNFLLQGATGFNYVDGFWYDRGHLWLGRNGQSKFFDRWHRKDLFDPNSEWVPGRFPSAYHIAGGDSRGNRADSEYWIRDATYLRLKSLEIGYSVDQSILSSIGMKSLRLSASGHNLLTWTGLKDVDPERGDQLIYPITRSFNFGVNLKF